MGEQRRMASQQFWLVRIELVVVEAMFLFFPFRILRHFATLRVLLLATRLQPYHEDRQSAD